MSKGAVLNSQFRLELKVALWNALERPKGGRLEPEHGSSKKAELGFSLFLQR